MLRASLPCPCSFLRVIAFAPLLLLALSATPARAGHWVLDASGSTTSGTASPVNPSPPDWHPPASTTTGAITLPAYGQSAVTDGVVTTGPTSATANLSVIVVGTWTADGKTDDTAPPSVVVSESSTALSSQSDGYTNSVGTVSDGIDVNKPDPATGVVTDQKFVPEPGGGFKVYLSLRASASASPGPFDPGDPPTCSSQAGVGAVTISIHAQPYNLHQTGFTSNMLGDALISFAWSSTDGILGDIKNGCTVHENVTYDGNPGTYKLDNNGIYAYFPTSPPIAAGTEYGDPTITTVPGSNGKITDTHGIPDFMKNYAPIKYTGTQNYLFNDTDTGQNNVSMPGNVAFPILIVRSIIYVYPSVTPYMYMITVNGNQYTTPLPFQ